MIMLKTNNNYANAVKISSIKSLFLYSVIRKTQWFLGMGYVMFFKLSKCAFLILLTVFLLSGSAYYFLAANSCGVENTCADFFGFPIVIHQKPNNQNMVTFGRSQQTSLNAVLISNQEQRPQQIKRQRNLKSKYTQTDLSEQNRQMDFEQSSIDEDSITLISSSSSAFLIFIAIIIIKNQVYNQINTLEGKRISPSHYTIMVQNLPTDQDVKETNLSDWAQQKLGSRPISVNIAYDVSDWQKQILQREKLTISLNKINISKKAGEDNYEDYQQNVTNSRLFKIKSRLEEVDRKLEDYKQRRISCRSAGTAFLTFQTPLIVHDILEKHKFHLVRSFFSNTFMKANQNTLTYKNQKVIVSPAPPPRGVIWENLSFRHYRSFLLAFGFVCSMIIVIIFGFQLQFYVRSITKASIDQGLNSVQQGYSNQATDNQVKDRTLRLDKIMQSVMLSVFVIGINSVLRLVIYFFSRVRRHYSYTKLDSSFCTYYSLTYIFNACFMVYIVRPTDNDSNQLLLQDVHLVMLANAFSQPLFKICDPIHWYYYLSKRYIQTLDPNKNPYTQGYVNRIYEGVTLSNGDNYQYLIRLLFITTWYAYCAPLGVIFSFIGLFFDYWITKYMLLRVYKTPQNISKSIAMLMLSSLELLPFVFICGVIQYNYNVLLLSNDNQIQKIPTLIGFLLAFTHYQVTLGFLVLVLLAYCFFAKTNKPQIKTTHYKKVEYLFTRNYQTQNPITKYKGELSYLSGLIQNKAIGLVNSREGKALSKLLQASRNSSPNFSQNKNEITKLKRRLLTKLTQNSNDHEGKESAQDLYELKQMKKYKKKSTFKAQSSDDDQ